MNRNNLKIKVGSYTGNATAHRVISGVGFQPRLIFGLTESTTDPSLKFDITASNFLDKLPSAAGVTARTEPNADGFNVDASTAFNPSAVVVHYVAIAGTSSALATGVYVGDGSDNRDITDANRMPFTPTIVGVKGQTITQGVTYRTPSMTGEPVPIMNAGIFSADRIQSIVTDGFRLGTNIAVNSAGVNYSYFAFPSLPNTMSATGTYVGTGVVQSITDLLFQPDFLLIKGDTLQQPVIATSTMAVGNARPISATTIGTNYINSLDSNGFTVGTDGRTNSSGATYHYWALKAGNWDIPITRTEA